MKIALSGTFGHWPHVFDELAKLPGAQLVGIARVCEDDDFAAVTGYGCFVNAEVPLYESQAAMLAAAKPDVVIVSCRIDRIAATATEAARAGCPVICEKPLALDHAALAELRAAVDAAGVRFLAMLTMRTLPVFATMRRLYREGAIGRLVLANARKSYRWGTRPAWFGERAKYGSTIGWLAIHGMDMIGSTTGERFAAVVGAEGNLTHADTHPDCADHGALMLKLSGGGLATISYDFLRPAKAPTHGDDWLRLVGSEGVLEGNDSAGTLKLINADGEQDISPDAKIPMYRNFVEEIRDGRAPDPLHALDDPFHYSQVCLDAIRAVAEWEERFVRVEE